MLQTFANSALRQQLAESAKWVRSGDYHKALVALRPARDYETALLSQTTINAIFATRNERPESAASS